MRITLRTVFLGIGATAAVLLASAQASAQQGSGNIISTALSVDGSGNATAACGSSGNNLTSILNTVLGTPSFDDESVAVSSRRNVYRYCDNLTATGANGWTGDSVASPEQAAAQATTLAPEEVFAGMDNADAAFDVQTSNVARRLSLVRLARRIDADKKQSLARRNSEPRSSEDALRAGARPEERGLARVSQKDDGKRVLLALQEGINAGDGTFGDGLGFFLNGRISIVDGEQNSSERASDGFGGGFTLGVDTALSDKSFVGIAMGYTRIETDYHGSASKADLDAVTFTGYGAFFPTDELYVDGSVGISYLGFEQTNDLVISDGGAPIGDLEGETDGVNVGFDVGVGYALKVDELLSEERIKGLTFEPFLRVNLLYTYIDDYNQGGGDGTLVLSIDEQETVSVTSTLGFRTEYPVSTKHGVLTPYFRAGYVHEFNKENDDVGVGLPAVGPGLVKLKAEATDSHYANIGLGLAATLGEGLSQFIDYDVIAAHENVTIHQITAGVRLEF